MSIVKKTPSCFNSICLLLLLLSFSIFTYGQEICNNGIDDNGNGLIDLNDSAGCACTPPKPSLIANPSFESMNCCPSSFSQMNCAQGWIQASSATADYMNTCGMVFPAATAAGLVPFPDGSGIAGLISASGYQEYIGSCLISPLLADSAYSLQMSIASTPISNPGGVCNGGVINYPPSNIVIYGSSSCSNLPFAGQSCPPSPWQVMGSAIYTPVNSWGLITINFTPTLNINAIIFGSPCSLPSGYTNGPCYPYFYFDNLFLNTTEEVSSATVITQTGNWCNNTSVLSGNAVIGATYQWYLSGVALVGKTALTLDVSGNNLPLGTYTLVVTVGAACSHASATVGLYSNPPVIQAAGPFCTYESSVLLNANIAGGVWSGAGITDASAGVFDPATASVGNNSVYYTLTNSGNCPRADTATIVVNASPVSNAGNDTTICSGGSGCVGAPPVIGYFYSWFPSSGLSSTIASNPSITEVNNGTTPLILNYSVITTDAATGCQSLDQVVVTINPTPSITQVGPFCNTDPAITLTSNISGGIWSGTGITNTSTGAFNPALATAGNNNITYTASGICPDSDNITIVVGAKPLSNAGADLTICSGTAGSIGSPLTAGSSYSWLPSAGLSSSSVSDPGITTVNNGTLPVVTTYTVTTSATGTSCQSMDSVIVTVNPQPDLEITDPVAVCSPATVDITLALVTSGTTGGGVFTYWLNSLATAALSSPGAIAASGTYYVKLTAAGGCTDIQPVNVTVNPAQGAGAGADLILCTGDTGSIGGNAIPGNTYSWNPSTGLTSSTASNPSVTLTNSGLFPVTAVYIVTTSSPACISKDTVNVTVNPLATADAGPTQTICASNGAVLAGVIGPSVTSGTWNGGNGNFAPNNSALNAIYTPDLAEINAGSVTLTLLTNDPPGSCAPASSSITISINASPTISAGSDDTICIGGAATLAGVFGGAATSGTWSGGGGGYSPDNTASNAVYTPDFSENGTGNASLVFTTDDPIGPCLSVSDSMIIIIRPSPTANAGANQYTCEGSTITLAGAIGGSAATGTWSGGGGTYSPNNLALNAVYTPSTAELAQDSLILTLTTDNPLGFPCIATSSNVIIYFYKNPVVNFSVNDSSGCPTHCVNFTDLTLAGGSSTISTWSWDFGDNSSGSDIPAPSHCYSQTGSYNVTLTTTSNNNCTGTLMVPQLVQVFSNPVAEFNASPNPSTVLYPTITLNDQSSTDVNYWFWNFGDGNTLSAANPSPVHIFPSDSVGIYYASLIVMNAAGCSDTVIHEIVIGTEFSFFIPSSFTPNNDGVNDNFRGEGIGILKYELMIFDRWGNLIFYSDDLDKAWDGKANKGEIAAQQDVYVWKVVLVDVFRKKHNYIGTVTIVK